MMLPPTQVMAAVPTMLSTCMKAGMKVTRPRPKARPAPVRALRAVQTPKSSAFTISATAP
ncbi:hypothetical protein D3C72_2256460 [compost metagenome]